MTDKEYYTSREVAQKLRVNIMTVYRYIKARKLKAHKIGKEFRIKHNDFEKFMSDVKTY